MASNTIAMASNLIANYYKYNAIVTCKIFVHSYILTYIVYTTMHVHWMT